ncbi:MAG TPA: DUF1707 domain-containing protein [Kribbella sp.]|nr:DUF1707 domain-containing protein [Kribbella sp.]
MNEERPGGPIRIGDREREDAVKRLGEHYEAGRLTAEEHSERVEQALKAKTDADLNSLFGDLPWAGPENSAAGAGNPGAGRGGFGGRPPWAARGFIGQIPLPLLIMLGVFGVLASIGCVFGAGHPPILPILLIVAAVSVIRKRRMERQA